MHDAFLQVWRNAASFDPERGNGDAWLISLVRYRALDIARRSGRETTGVDVPEQVDEDPDALTRLVASAEGTQLRACLEQVDPPRRNLIVLAFIDGVEPDGGRDPRQPTTWNGQVHHPPYPSGLARVLADRSRPRTRGPGMSDLDDDDLSMLAAEYVLGTLDVAGMRQAEAISARDPDFAAELVFWQDKLTPMVGLVSPVAPPPVLWSRIALATGIGSDPRRSVWGGRGLWQGTTVAALALAASFAFIAFLPQNAVPPPSDRFAAALAPLAAPAQFLAVAQPDGSLVLTSLTGNPAPQGHDYQLWELPKRRFDACLTWFAVAWSESHKACRPPALADAAPRLRRGRQAGPRRAPRPALWYSAARSLRSTRHQHPVDDIHDSVGLLHVVDQDAGDPALRVFQDDVAGSVGRDPQLSVAHRVQVQLTFILP